MAKKKPSPEVTENQVATPQVTAEPIPNDENLSTDRPIGGDVAGASIDSESTGSNVTDSESGGSTPDTRGTGISEDSGDSGSPDPAGYGEDTSGSTELPGDGTPADGADGSEAAPGDVPENDSHPRDPEELESDESGLAEESPEETGNQPVVHSLSLKDRVKAILAGTKFNVLEQAPVKETPEEARSRRIREKAAAELSQLKAKSLLRTLENTQQSEERATLEDRYSKES